MASKDETKKTNDSSVGLWIGVAVAIALVVGALVYYFWKSRASGNNANLGTPAPTGNAGVTGMPSPSNVSAGVPRANAGGAVGRVGPQL